MIDLSIIYLKDLKSVFPYKDSRSVVSALKRLGIEIHGKPKSKFVFKIQLERAQIQDRIKSLKHKYGNNWLKVFQAEMKTYAEHRALMEGKLIPKGSTPYMTNPQLGPQGKLFLEELNEDLQH